jgi:predicted porin
MRPSSRVFYRRGVSLILGALALVGAGTARAEIVLFDKDGWTVKTDGLAQGFYQLGTGDSIPAGVLSDFGGFGGGPPGADGKWTQSRFRSGWTGGRFNWRITHQLSEKTKVHAVLGVAYAISTQNNPVATDNNWDIRNGFMEIESTWGDLVIGRSVGLYTLGTIISTINNTSAALGLGNACGMGGDGLGCYTTGYGAKFPGFWAGVFYTTPDMGGLKIKLSAVDPTAAGQAGLTGMGVGGMAPVALSQRFARTPLPMFQTLVMYNLNLGTIKINPFFNGFWQRLGKAGSDDNLDTLAGGAGIDLTLGPVKVGGGGTAEKGDSLYAPLITGSPIDGAGQLRSGTSFYVHALASLGPLDVNAGYGQATLNQSDFDKLNNLPIIDTHRNIYAGLQYHVGPITWVAELNLLHHTWHQSSAVQDVTLVTVGADFAY